MFTSSHNFLILIILFLFSAQRVNAFQDTESHSHESVSEPVIGLALSAGGAKGFAHIGVLKVLEENRIPIKVVTGTSMGAVIGGLYAMGYTANQIQEIALNADWSTYFNERYRPDQRGGTTYIPDGNSYLLTFPIKQKRIQLPASLIDGQNISTLLYRLTLPYHDLQDFTLLPRAFGCVATDLATGEGQLLTEGYLPDAIRASIAIPTVFTPVTIGNRTYIDGGVARSIPAKDARTLGADYIITSDVGEPVKPVDSLRTFLDIISQSIGFHQQESDSVQITESDIYIRPNIKSFDSFDYHKVSQLIRQGEEAARSKLPEILNALNNHQNKYESSDTSVINKRNSATVPIPVTSDQRITISRVAYNNLDSRLTRVIDNLLNLKLPANLTVSQLERRINRLYELELFSHVSYRLRNDEYSTGENKLLVFDFTKREQDRLGLSLRYDTQYKASLRAGVQLRDKLESGDALTANLRLGEIMGLQTGYSYPFSVAPVIYLNLHIEAKKSPIDIFTDRNRTASLDIEQLEIRTSLSSGLFKDWAIEGGIFTEWYHAEEEVGSLTFANKSDFLLGGFGALTFNTLNQPVYPTRGAKVKFNGAITNERFLSQQSFNQFFSEIEFAVPLFNKLSIGSQLLAGYSSTDDLPVHYFYYFGGLTPNTFFADRQYPMLGFSNQELRGDNFQAVKARLLFNPFNNIYLQAEWDAAYLSENWTWNPFNKDYFHGFGITAGALTLIGPVQISLSSPDLKEHYAIKIDVGYNF